MEKKLNIDRSQVAKSREYAGIIADGIEKHIKNNTTSSVERTVLRLLGIDGVKKETDIPLPNILVEEVQKEDELGKGIAYWLGNALLETDLNPQQLAEEVANESICLMKVKHHSLEKVRQKLSKYISIMIDKIDERKKEREDLMKSLSPGTKPWLYVIVATGNIYEDLIQAKAAARQGANIIAVIRSTAQSLLDYVPYGATTEGFGGTYATQENFRIMREGLDEIGQEIGRYIQLVNYASGLAMPEITALGAMERLDMLLNDAMYGILFRDINMKRTFIDQYFSRMINAYAGLTINTGEDNYLTTADAVEEAHTVLASQFINEELGYRSGLQPEQMGLGHAFEINPEIEDGFLLEIAQAQLVREIFPDAVLKYMPPTKYMSGDVFKGHLQDGMFNLASIMTGQSIQLLGMLTEAIHTPFMSDRALSIENARYIFNNARHLSEEIFFKRDGRIEKRAKNVLAETVQLLAELADLGLMEGIEKGIFADISRPIDGGKGADGVIRKDDNYYNPFMEIFEERLGL